QAILLGAPLAPLTYLVAKRLFPPLLASSSLMLRAPHLQSARVGEGSGVRSEYAAKISAWVVAAYPLLLVYPLGLGTENPFFILLLVAFFFLFKSIEIPTTRYFLLSGFFLGLVALTRSVILPFAGLAVLWALFSLKQRCGAIILAV